MLMLLVASEVILKAERISVAIYYSCMFRLFFSFYFILESNNVYALLLSQIICCNLNEVRGKNANVACGK
jgi:hypothetical protein